MKNVIVRAQKTSQGGLSFYLFLIPSNELLDISYVIRRSEDSKKGIQRIASKERISEIAQFVNEAKDIIFPNNLIVNFDKEIIFRPNKDKSNEGDLIIPKQKRSVQIIDGQHRLLGLEVSQKNIPIIVVGFTKLGLIQRAQIFLTINSKQKGINTSLMYDLFGITRSSKSVELLAVDIGKFLNSDPDSPFKDMVKLTDARKKGKESLSLAAFVTAVKKVLANKDVPFSNLDYHQQVLTLRNYFQAVKNLFKAQWGIKGYILTKTLGFNALMKVFPKVHLRCILKQDLLCNNVKEEIETWKDFDFLGKTWAGVSGEAGATKVADQLADNLKKLG